MAFTNGATLGFINLRSRLLFSVPRSLDHSPQPACDGGVVSSGMREGFGRQPAPGMRTELSAVGVQLREDARVVRSVTDDSNAIVILRRGAQHARPPDVDVLDQLFEGRP